MKNYHAATLIFVLFMLGCVNQATTYNQIEGVKWQLVELSGTALGPLSGDMQPFIVFDEIKSRIDGYNGCNNYFGHYERYNQTLTFGPIAATRRACPDTETMVESKLLFALENTNTWQIKDNRLSLLKDSEILAVFTLINSTTNRKTPDLQSLTIQSKVYSTAPVQLTHGEYRAPAAPDSATEVVIKLTDNQAFGTLNTRPAGVIVVITSLGGTGVFSELVLLSRNRQGWLNTDTVLLGDRVRINSIVIRDDKIAIDMTTHGPQEPMCCPTTNVNKYFTVKEGKLIAIENRSQYTLSGSTWQWVHTRYNNDTEANPVMPGNYTVSFTEEGKLNIKADCNLKSGIYTATEKQISMQIINTTMSACDPGSLEDQFVRDLTAGVIYFFRDDDLYIDLMYDTGTMKFSRIR